MENTFSTLLLKTHFILLFYHSPLFTLLEPPIIILGVYIIDTGVDIHTDMPKFTPVLSMAVHHLYIDDTRKYHNRRSHTCNSAVNPSCCVEVRTSFRYKINLAKVLSKPRSHTHFGTK